MRQNAAAMIKLRRTLVGVLVLLKRAIRRKRISAGNGLEVFAGTWTAEEADEFDAAVTPFEQVDAKLWE